MRHAQCSSHSLFNPIGTPHAQVSEDEKLKVYLRIAMLHLQSGDSINAEAYINRASHLEHATNDEELRLQFRAQRVRIFDFKRKFIDAAQGCVAFTAYTALLSHCCSLTSGHSLMVTH